MPSDLPCLMIKIEDQYFLTELDLGFRGEVVFTTETIQAISNKTLLGEKIMYGVTGSSYNEKEYSAPPIEIGKLTFSNCVMDEQPKEFVWDSCIVKNEDNPCQRAPGRVGWKLFRNCNLFLDLANSKIAFCDSPKTLEEQGFLLKEFVKTPLYLDRGLLEIVVGGLNGFQMWTLDTGATWNIVHTENNAKSIQEMAQDPSNEYTGVLKIGDREFGPMPLHKLPLRLPIPLNGMLGMEFFKTHQVFIDFAENQVYIRKIP